jgi:hypothetical protein
MQAGAVLESPVPKTDVVGFGMSCSTGARYAGKLGGILTLAVEATCFQRRSKKFTPLAPLGERVARSRRFHQPGRDG